MTRTLQALLATSLLVAPATAFAQDYRLGDATTEENSGKAVVPLNITGTRTAPSYVTVYAGIPTDTGLPNVDYVPTAKTFEVLPTDARLLLELPILNNTLPEPTKYITVKGVVNRGGRMLDGTARITLTDLDKEPPIIVVPEPPVVEIGQLSVPNKTFSESVGTAVAQICRINSSNVGAVTADFHLDNATAQPGLDYIRVVGTATIPAGQGCADIPFAVLEDTIEEGDETLNLLVTRADIPIIKGQGVLTIAANDKPTQPPQQPPLCPDGSTPVNGVCPPVVQPPIAGYIPSPTLAGLPAIASNFDTNLALDAGTSAIPPSGAPDVVGAFRFICGAGQIAYDDPILFPGQPGKSHLHQFFGNVTFNGNTDYGSARAAGDSTCNWSGLGVANNRSGYWMPAMLDGKGNVVRPDYVSIYYKQRPQGDPKITDPNAFGYMGKGIQLPNGIRFIFGWDPTGLNSIRTGQMWFNCRNTKYNTLAAALAVCGPGDQVGAVINAPDCWDGKNIDVPDHRSHMAYGYYDPNTGQYTCPLATHPYNIPTFTMGAWWSIAAGEDDSKWSFASDHMAPGQPAGYTFHADFFMAWDPSVHNTWWQNCINKLLNCSGGQLGNGRVLKGAASHALKTDYLYNTRLVPLSSIPGGGTPPATVNNMLAVMGDSISVHHPGNYTGTYCASRPTVTCRGLAVGGTTLVTMQPQFDQALALKPEVATILPGANDLGDMIRYPTEQSYVDYLFSRTDPLRAAGIKVLVGTTLVQNNNPNHNARLPGVRSKILGAVGTRIDGAFDVGNPAGPMGTWSTANFQDDVHPTYSCGYDCGGQGKMATIFRPVADAALGN